MRRTSTLIFSRTATLSFESLSFLLAVPKYYLWPKVMLHNIEQWNQQTTDEALQFEWDPESLSYPHLSCGGESSWCNGTSGDDLIVTVDLVGYVEPGAGENPVVSFVHVLKHSTMFKKKKFKEYT